METGRIIAMLGLAIAVCLWAIASIIAAVI